MENKYEQQLKKEWERFEVNNGLLPNIMLLGVTGGGKSSLINRIFGKEIAPVNDVSRGTDGFITYWGKDYDMGVNLVDSRGYEMEDGSGESFGKYRNSIIERLKESESKDPLEKIHIIWFCISVAGEVIQKYDIEILKLLRSNPEIRNRVAVVLTKCDEDDENETVIRSFKKIIQCEVSNDIRVFRVSINPGLALDQEKMIEWSVSQLDNEDLKEAFVKTQMIDLKSKREVAAKVVAGYSTAAAAVGATPIPFSDAALITPIQVTMSARVIQIYGMDSFAGISKTILGNIVVSALGKSLAGGLIKLIPGIGTLVGGLINAGVAGVITTTIGFAISGICYDSCKKIANGETVDWTLAFSEESIQRYTSELMKSNKNMKL